MNSNKMSESKKKYTIEYEAFQDLVSGKNMKFLHAIYLICKIPIGIIEGILRYIPGPLGFKLRYCFYKIFLKHLGKNVLIDTGVSMSGLGNISIKEFSWIDQNTILNAYLGEIIIGKRVHIAPNTILGSREPIIVGDYVGIGAGVKVYSNSESHYDGKRMSGPMVPETMKAFKTKLIKIGKESCIGANSVILPGANIGEGAVVGANSTISIKIKPYTVVIGLGTRVGKRSPVIERDI